MKTASAELIALLNSTNQYIMADCYTVTLADGTVYRWTDAGYPLTVDGDDFLAPPDAPIVKRGGTRQAIGLEISTLEMTLEAGDGNDGGFLLDGETIPNAADMGVFDGAEVLVQRVFMVTFGDTSFGPITLFRGAIARVQSSSTDAKFTIESDMAKLTAQMPRNLFMPACAHVLFDAGCTLDRASFVVTGAVAGGGTPTTVLFRTNLTEADHYFRLGVLTWTSGAMAGTHWPVKSYLNANGLVGTGLAMPHAPEVGDTFEIIPGCDKSQGTCDTKFSNIDHFRGFPFVPAPEAAR